MKKTAELLILAASLIIVGLIGIADYYVSPEISLQIFYIIPIAVSTWFLGKKFTLIPLGLAVAFWFMSDYVDPRAASSEMVAYWNIASRAAFFVAFIYLISSLHMILKREKLLSRIDYLTQIANKRHFFEAAYREINRANRTKHPMTIAYIDMDNFKRVNDKFGHPAGDELLRLTAQTLKKHVRASDIIARVGGDEFALLLPETGYETAKIVINRARKEVLNLFEKHYWPVTLSIGAVTSTNTIHVLEPLIEKADSLMYHAKRSGKNMVKHDLVK